MPAENIKTLFSSGTITTAVSAVVSKTQDIPDWVSSLTLDAVFLYGSSGTTVKVFIQTSFDGTNWMDIACFAFTTAAGRKVVNLRNVSVTTPATITDAALADNSVIDGFIGPMLRSKYVTTGTYAGATSCVVTAKLGK